MADGPTIFISYKRRHEPSLALVAALEVALTQSEFRVLHDVDIEPGERWPDELWRWLMACSGAVAVVTDEAAASDWCRREWSVLAARESQAGLRVVPVQVEPVGPEANILDQIQAVRADDRPAEAVAQAVAERLQQLQSGPPTPADYLAAHGAWLGWQYDNAPALGREPFTLADVYIDTECGVLSWGTLKDDRSVDPFSEEHGGRVDLVDAVLDHFADPDLREPVVVQGPAGSGKSAFSLHLANRLADEGLLPVLVRFRDLRLSSHDNVDELLQDAVRVAPVGEHPPAPTESLFGQDQLAEVVQFRGTKISRMVVILDGWDEVALTGSARFQVQIEELLPRLRQRFTDGTGPPVRLLLTGRPSAAVERSRMLRQKTPVLTIRPLQPDQLRLYADRISRHLAGTDWVLDLAPCEQAFTSYEAWFTDKAATGTDVLGSPLLALLAFRTLAEWEGSTDDLFDQPTALYHALIDVTVAHAGKAEEGPEGTVHRGGRSLRRLLQRVASIITTQGSESASFLELERRLEGDDALTDWAEQATSESTLHELVVNFYFKGHPELGCEFLHKSFREYLFAEAVVAALEVVCEGQAGPQPPPSREWGQDFTPGSIHRTASRSLAGLLSPQWLTPEVRTHLFWLVEQAVVANPDHWVWVRDLLVDIWSWWGEAAHLRFHPERIRGQWEPQAPPVLAMMEDQLPYDGRPWRFSPSPNELDAHLGDALLQLTAFVHAHLQDHDMTGTRACQVGDSGAVRFRPFNGEARNLIACIGSSRRDALVGAYLQAVDLSDEDLQRCDLSSCDLSGADLSNASLRQSDLKNTNLSGARLGGASLSQAFLDGANLTNSDLTGLSLIRAHLTRADLTGADLTSAYLNSANLGIADLTGANLSGANLHGANLTSADLIDTNLNSANLSDADLRNARLIDAHLNRVTMARTNLTDANLIDAYLPGTDLTDANLTNAYLTGANLAHADLTGANLVGADLYGADLSGVQLHSVKLQDANLYGAELDAAQLRDAAAGGANVGTATKQVRAPAGANGDQAPPDGSEDDDS